MLYLIHILQVLFSEILQLLAQVLLRHPLQTTPSWISCFSLLHKLITEGSVFMKAYISSSYTINWHTTPFKDRITDLNSLLAILQVKTHTHIKRLSNDVCPQEVEFLMAMKGVLSKGFIVQIQCGVNYQTSEWPSVIQETHVEIKWRCPNIYEQTFF